MQFWVISARRVHCIERLLLTVMRRQRGVDLAERMDGGAARQLRALARDLVHHFIDIFEFAQSRPSRIALPPVRTGLEPDCEGFREVFVGMALRIPEAKMLHVILACRIGTIEARIMGRGAAEQFLPAAAALQPERVLHHVSGLVAENAHAFVARAAFHVDDHLAFEPHQARMRKVERDCNTGRGVGAEPLVRQPRMRTDAQVAFFKLLLQVVEATFQPGVLDRKLQVPEPELQELVIRQRRPCVFSAHLASCSV